MIIYVATAFWCDDVWVIAAGADHAAVMRDADIAVLKPRDDGVVAEDYLIEQIEESK